MWLFVGAITLNSCGQITDNVNQSSSHKYTNHLVDENSPYLLQHAHNPVNWYPWGEEALTKAKEENKLIIISIGYAACHWCHVMEKESFEDSTVAAIMNEHFVSIKVDKQERPDIDQIYMEAAQLINGRGGWPLNAIALPDGRPIFADSYFPKENWISLLDKIQDIYKNNPEKAHDQAEQVTKGINATGLVTLNKDEQTATIEDLTELYGRWKETIDFKLGGQKTQMKFPNPVAWQYLMNYSQLTDDASVKEAVLVTLNKMALGGIYDQIGGGFARYSTDIQWKVPHFEKMLYDNGQLVSLYSNAYQLTKDPLYKEIVYQTLAFVKRELTTEEGAFYSSLDADSEGEEGKFYVWEKSEIEEILSEESAELFCAYYNISEEGNWEEGKNILLRKSGDEEFALEHNLTIADLKEKVMEMNSTLLAKRENRERPPLDDNVLTSWNALMLKGYVDAYRVFGDPSFLESAIKNAKFIEEKATHEGSRLSRNYKDGTANINGFLGDYALVSEAFIALYQATFDESWIYKAEAYTNYAIEHFENKDNNMFYYTSDEDAALVARKLEVHDGDIPASNSVMAKNLYMLGEYLYKPEWVENSKQMVNNMKTDLMANASYYGNWATVMSWMVAKPYEVAIVGENHGAIRTEFDQHFLPYVFYMGGESEGKLPLLENKLVDGETTIYVCQNKSCRLPVTTIEMALKQID